MKFSAALVATAATVASAKLQPVVMKGSKLFYENGTQFFMKGIAYQQDTAAAGGTNEEKTSYKDPLANESACKRDVPLLKELGVNIIRTYAIDPEENHDACMKLLDDAGIYVISDLSEPSNSINRDDPKWDTTLFKRYTGVVDNLAAYDNVVGFFAGNEVSNNKSNTEASAFVKAAVRDTKKYIKDNKSRWLGVGYAANDDKDIRIEIADYFNCGPETDSIDYWGYNIYSWCGKSSMELSGYSDWVKFFSNYSVPVFFAEYGCNEPDGAAGRIWQETTALYQNEMTKVFSGGIVYMYFQEANDYGVVEIENNKAVKLKDFKGLAEKHAAADPKGVDEDEYSSKNKPASCPALSDNWRANSKLPPSPDSDLCDCMISDATCVPVPGLKPKAYGDIFDYICGEKPEICKGFQANATTGVYGAYSMCDAKAQLTYVLDAYYKELKSDPSACDHDGQAKVQKSSAKASCSKGLAAASSQNKEVATATSAPDADSTDDSGDDDSFGNPSAALGRLFTLGDFAVGAYLAVAAVVGASMVL